MQFFRRRPSVNYVSTSSTNGSNSNTEPPHQENSFTIQPSMSTGSSTASSNGEVGVGDVYNRNISNNNNNHTSIQQPKTSYSLVSTGTGLYSSVSASNYIDTSSFDMTDISLHPKVQAVQAIQWDHSVYSLSVARTAFGAAVVQQSASTTDDNTDISFSYSREVIVIAGGRSRCPVMGRTTTRAKVLDSIEIFDPSQNTQAQLCPHRRLHVGRYSCGSFAVTKNVICVLGGKDQKNEYLNSVELVSSKSVQLLGDMFLLPQPMACFCVTTVSGKIYLIGGKSKDSTLSSIYVADLSYFVNADQGEDADNDHPTTIWKLIGSLESTSGSAPRHSFSLVTDGDVCWLIGGFDGKKLLNSVGLYHTKFNKYMVHPLNLAVARSGLTSFALGKCIVVVGGIASASNNTPYVGGRRTEYPSNVNAELLLRLDGTDRTRRNEVLVSVPNLECPQNDQCVYQIGYKLYAIGQYNFLMGEPTSNIPSLNVFDLREVFDLDLKIEGILVANDFTIPVVPVEPAEPKMSPDVEKLKHSIAEWKNLTEEKTREYIANVHEATASSTKLHDQEVRLWIQEISKTNQALNESNPHRQNNHDKQVMISKIDALRLEFERQKLKLEQETIERMQRRDKEYEAQSIQCNTQIMKLEEYIAEYGSRLQQHQDRIQTNLLNWINAKKLDIANMEGIVAGSNQAPKPRNENEREMDIFEDSRNIHRVFSGLEIEPVMVSKEYGLYCTNNYDTKNEIGAGGFGSVYKGNDTTLQCTFAFKRVSMMADNPAKLQGVLKSFQREISTLKRVRHPNIVALYGYHIEPGSDNSFLVYELLDRGSLATYLKNEDDRIRLPYLRRMRIMAETLRALNFLHTGGCAGLEIQHRDIKPYNICLAEDWSSKLIDCGLARIERTEELSMNGGTNFISSTFGLVGTDGYICRAYWNGMRPYQSACDIYSFGIVMVELLTGSLNRQSKEFPGDFYNHYIASISGIAVQNSLPKLMERCDELVVWNQNDIPVLCKLALQCLSLDVNKRPTAKTLVYEISKILLRGEIGDLPEEFTTNDSPNVNKPSCSICNEHRHNSITCKNMHHICNQCITQEAVMASNTGSEIVKCPIMECRCTFDIQKDLYAIVPQDVYVKTSAEGKILEYLERIEQKQNLVVSEISLVRKGVNRGLQALASLTTSGNSPCPRLVWIIPSKSFTVSAGNPSTWIQKLTDVPVKVYFICEHTFTPINKPVILTVKKKWLQKVAPALKVTLFVLKLTTTLAGLPFPMPNIENLSKQVAIATQFVDSLLDTVQCHLINRSETLFTDGTQDFDSEQMKSLTGQAYDLLADGVRTGGQLSWQDELKPVLNENGATIWVKNDHVPRYNLSL